LRAGTEPRAFSSGGGYVWAEIDEPLCGFNDGWVLGPELRRAEVDFDRNYDNYDEFELRYRNFDNVISIGFKNTAALC